MLPDKGIKKLSCTYSKSLNQIYIIAHTSSGQFAKFKKGVYIPVPRSQGFDMKMVEKYQNELSTDQSVTLAICDFSSAIIYYNLKQKWYKNKLL